VSLKGGIGPGDCPISLQYERLSASPFTGFLAREASRSHKNPSLRFFFRPVGKDPQYPTFFHEGSAVTLPAVTAGSVTRPGAIRGFLLFMSTHLF